jgi:hypothetical protein
MVDSNANQIAMSDAIRAGGVPRSEWPRPSGEAARQSRSHNQDASRGGETSPNMLLIGGGVLADAFLAPLMPLLAAPIVYLDAANPSLPSTSVGTLIVSSIGRLTPSDQTQLLGWLDARGETTVIAVADRSLFPRVRRGAFLDPLYYRLNTIVVDLRTRPGR